MRRTTRRALAVGLCGAVGCGRAEAPTRTVARDSSEVAALVHARLRAALAGDTAAWHRSVSDSCLWSGAALHVASTREVLAGIVANRAIRPGAQEVRDLVVYLTADVAQAAYVQEVRAAQQSAGAGKRFRKVDTFVRRGPSWLLIGAAEAAIRYRPRVSVTEAGGRRLVGRYALGAVDTLTVAVVAADRFTLRGRAGTVDTLLAESDTVLYADGDAGSWVFVGARAGPARELRYRSVGAADVILGRVRDP